MLDPQQDRARCTEVTGQQLRGQEGKPLPREGRRQEQRGAGVRTQRMCRAGGREGDREGAGRRDCLTALPSVGIARL